MCGLMTLGDQAVQWELGLRQFSYKLTQVLDDMES